MKTIKIKRTFALVAAAMIGISNFGFGVSAMGEQDIDTSAEDCFVGAAPCSYHTNPQGNDDWWYGIRSGDYVTYSHYNNYGLEHKASVSVGFNSYVKSGWQSPGREAQAEASATMSNNHAYYDIR